MTGLSQVLSPLQDLQDVQTDAVALLRLPPVRLPRKDRFRFEMPHPLYHPVKLPSPAKDSEFSKPAFPKHRKPPADSPRNKVSASPPHTRYATMTTDLGVPASTKARGSDVHRPLHTNTHRQLTRHKHSSVAAGSTLLRDDSPDASKHLPTVVNLTYEGLRTNRKQPLRFKVLPIRRRKPERGESPATRQKLSLSPIVREESAQITSPPNHSRACSSSVDTPTSMTPYLTPKLTRRVVFTKEAG